MIQVVSGSTPASIGSGVQYTNLLGGLRQTIATVPVGDIVPIACTLRNIFLRISVAPGVGASRVFTLMIGGSPTGATITIADDQTFGAFLSPDISLVADSYVHLKCEEFGGPATAGFIRYSYEVETDGATTAVFFGNGAGAINSYPTKFGGVLNQIAPWGRDIDGYPGDCINVMPIDGTITGYRLRFARGLPNKIHAEPCKHDNPPGILEGTFTIYKSTDGGASFIPQIGPIYPETRLERFCPSSWWEHGDIDGVAFSLPVSRGDLLYMRWDNMWAGSAQWGVSVGVTFESSVANQWPYCGEPTSLSGGGGSAEYNAIFAPHSFGWSGTQAGRIVSEGGVSDFSLSDFILYLHTSPGAGDTRVFETMLNGTPQTLAVTLSDSDQIAEDLINNVPIVYGDLFGLKMSTTGSPAASKVSWGFIQDTSTATGGGGEIPGDLPILGEIGPYMVHHWPREIP